MKASLKLFSIAVIILFASNSFSMPLNGTYTIGSGGDYPTINSAFSAALTQGIDGPVIFDVITGTYNETVNTNNIPGSSMINTVTLKSHTGNSPDVVLNSLNISSSNIFIIGLSIDSDVNVFGSNVNFSNNNFRNHNIGAIAYKEFDIQDLYIIGNTNIANMYFIVDDSYAWFPSLRNVQIKNNIIHGELEFRFCQDVIIENNSIGNGINTYGFSGKIIKNEITGTVDLSSAEADLINNFIIGNVRSSGLNLINNSIIGGSLTVPSFTNYHSAFIINNIIINPAGGPTFSSNSPYFTGSDHNDFYNGGNNNLIEFNGASYNNVLDFYNATGFDQHSNSCSVTFLSSTDLHLAGSSVTDLHLAGIPSLFVPDDIDGQTRSLIHPYKGADEADFPLPVELSSFTSSVNNNNVQLYWTTASETNNSGFDVERSIVNGEWSKVNFIKGHGNSTTPQNYSFTDKNLSSGKYKYRLKQIDFNGNFEYHNLSNEVVIGVPEKFSLSQNYPNPFNPTTKINYELRITNYVSIIIYDVLGNKVGSLVNQKQNAGSYEVEFDGSNLASGAYFYKLEAGSYSQVRKMLLMK